MEDANDADGPNGGRRAHKKRIRRIEDSDESEGDTENNQLTSCRKSNRPAMDHSFQRSSSEGSDDSSDSSDDIDSVNTDESIEEDSNESNADLSSEWDTESENEEVEEDISRPSTSRGCRLRNRNSSHSSILPDKELSPSNLPSDRMATEGPADDVEGKVVVKVQDDFHGSSSETDDGEGPKTRCPICLKSLRGPGGAEVGSPEGCQHCFCVPCIQEWAKNVNTCPVDRHEFSEIVVLDGVCGKEIRRLRIPKKTRSSGTQDDDDVTLISQIEEDPTYCEVCGSGDREDSLLLCDGCDRGYHLECLIPPLTSVPIEEWFCPSCTEAATSRLRSAATRGMRLLPRTSASQRVLRNLRRNVRIELGQRGLRTWNLASRDLEVMEDLAELEAERRWAESMSNSARPSTSAGSFRRRPIKKKRKVYRKKTTRKKRKTVTKKRTILGKDGEEEEEEVEEEEVTTTSKRKARKRRKMGGRRSRRTRRGMVKRFKSRARLAESLGMGPGKDNLLRRKGACGRGGVGGAAGYGGDGGVVLNGTTSNVGGRVPTLSIFGSSNDLEYFSGGSDVEGGGGSVAVASAPRPIDSAHARQLAKERLMLSAGTAAERRKALIKERAIAASSPSNSSSGVPDLLGSIMDSQSVWHGRKARVKMNPDGSFAVDKPKNGAPPHTAEQGEVPSSVSGPKSVEVTSLNNEMNVSSNNTRVPSNPAEPSSTAQDSCSSFREGNSGVGLHERVAGVEAHKAMEDGRPVWPIRTPETDSRATSSGSNRKERVPTQNTSELVYPSRVLTPAGPGSTPTRSRATNNFRSIEHLAGNVIVNSNPSYVNEDHSRVIWDSRPMSNIKNVMGSVITSNYSRLASPMPERVILGGADFGSYESSNTPLDLSNSSHKIDNNGSELLHRNMYLDLSSGGSRRSSLSMERCFQETSGDTVPEDLRVLPIPIGQTPPHFRSHSVIRENPAVELSCRTYSESLSQEVHSNISELPPPVTETVSSALITPMEAMKTVGLPGSSGNDNANQSVNSSVRDVPDGRTSSSGGTRGTSERVEYARTNSSFTNTSGSRDALNPGHGGGGGGGDRNNRPQLLKRRVDEEEDDEKDDREDDEDEDVDIYSDIEPGGSDPPTDGDRPGLPPHTVETPPDQGSVYHPSAQAGGSEKYDPAEPSYDTDDEMVIDEEGGNEDESHTSRSASLEGEVPPPPPLPPTLLDSITKPGGGMGLSPQAYDRERSVTPTEEDERRKVIGKESDPVGIPPVGRVYGILSQGKFGLGVSGYGSDDDEEEDEGCPNFSIYSAASMDIARTADAAEEEPKKESPEMTPCVDEMDGPPEPPEKDVSSSDQTPNPEESSGDQSDSNRLPTPEQPETSVEDVSKEAPGDDFTLGDEINYEKDVDKSDAEKSDDEAEKSDAKSDAEVEKSDAEPDKSDAEAEKSDVEAEKSDIDKSDTEPEKLAEIKSHDGSLVEDEGHLEAISDKEFDITKESKDEKGVHRKDDNLEDSERSAILVPELEGLETETISEAEEATAFEDLEASKRRSCGGEEEEGEIIDDRVREKTTDQLVENVVIDEVEKGPSTTEVKISETSKKESKKEGKRRTRKKADPSKTDEAAGDSAIAWKKLSKTGKERNYRDSKTEDPLQTKKDMDDKEDKENRKAKKDRERKKSKRKDLERYDVRKVVGERSKTKRRRTDAFGRELRSNSRSRSRSRSRIFSRSRSRGVRSRSRGGRSRSRGQSRSRAVRSRSRGVRSRSRGRWSRSRRSRSRGNSRGRASSKGRRSRSRGKAARPGRSRSRSRPRQRSRSRSRGARSRSHGGRSRSRHKSRDHGGRRAESGKTAVRKRRRTRSPISERKRSRSRSRQRRRSRSRSRRRKNDQVQEPWERSYSRSWSRSATPVHSRSMEKSRGHMRSRSMSGSRVYHDRTPPPLSRTPSRSRGRSLCRSPSTPNLPLPQRGRLGPSLSRTPSRTPERLRSPAMAAVSKKKKKKKEGRKKDVEVIAKRKKKRRERSPAASKEVFASGDNILVSVSFKSAPKETSNAPKRRKASSPVEEKVKILEEPIVDPGIKKKRKFMPVVKKKPSVIIDLETSPFVERIPSPADLIVLSDSSGENEDKAAKQPQQMDQDSQRRHRMMLMSPVSRKLGSNGVKEKRAGKVSKKGKLGGKGKKTVGKKERKAAAATMVSGIPPPEPASMEEPPLPLSVPEEPSIERRLGPKTPPEPQVKFCIASKGTQLRSVNNPLREDDDDEDVDDEIVTPEPISSAPLDIVPQNVQNEDERLPASNGDSTPGEPEVRQTIQVGPNTPPGPLTPDAEATFNEGVAGNETPPTTQEEVISRPEEENTDANKESATFEETTRKDQEMDTYDPFEPTNSPAPSPPAPETEPVHTAAEESRDVPANSVDGASQVAEERPPEEEVAVAEPRAEEPVEIKTEEVVPPPAQSTAPGVTSITRTLGTAVHIDAVGGLVLPILAQLGAVAQPLNAAVAAVTSANSPVIQQQQQQQLSPLVNRAFPHPPQAKAADVIRSLFGSGLRQFPEVVTISGSAGAFSASQPKTSKTDISLGGGARAKGGPRVAVTAPRVAVATPRVIVPTPRVAVTPRVATANGKDPAPGSGQDRVDVVDMDLESPYSPASSEGDDLFEPPSYESAAPSRQPSMMNQTQQPSKAAVKGNQRPAQPASTQDKFDNLFGGSPMRRNTNSTGGGKLPQRSVKNHKGSSKSGKPRSKGKVNVRSEEDHHLTILDELPNSAVELQVKEKFMIKLNRQERVVEEVKLALKPHYNKKHLSKEEYKDILRRSVPKICHNRHGEINPIRIRSLVEAYVKKFRYARKKDANPVPTNAVKSGKGKKVA